MHSYIFFKVCIYFHHFRFYYQLSVHLSAFQPEGGALLSFRVERNLSEAKKKNFPQIPERLALACIG